MEASADALQFILYCFLLLLQSGELGDDGLFDLVVGGEVVFALGEETVVVSWVAVAVGFAAEDVLEEVFLAAEEVFVGEFPSVWVDLSEALIENLDC